MFSNQRKINYLLKISLSFIMVAISCPFFSFPTAQAQSGNDFSTKSIIVKFKKDLFSQEIILDNKQTVSQAVKFWSARPEVEYAEPNYSVKASFIPSDEHFSNQWYLTKVKASEAWNINAKSPTIIIAIIDSGVQILHPDIKPNLWINGGEIKLNNKDDDKNGLVDDIYGWDFVNNFSDPSPKFKKGFTESGVIHGTVIAGIAAAAGNNQQGIAGITWQSKIMSLKALDDQGNGNISAVIKSIDYAVAKGANIINLSFVGFNYSRALEDALRRARQAGVIVVAPAGNEQPTVHGLNLNQTPLYPACFRDRDGKKLVIGVAATDAIDQKTNFSGYGSNCIDIVAPGISFYSTSVYAPDKSSGGRFFNQFYDGYWSGTSMAVPIVSGTLALIQGTNPTLSPADSVDILLKTADDINQLNPEYLSQLGSGRVNVAQAVFEAALRIKRRRAQFVFAPADSKPSLLTITDSGGKKEKEFYAYNKTFSGGVNLAAGDVNGDGNGEIIVAPAKDLEADIRIFNHDGVMLSHFLAYPFNFRGGVNVAAADVDGDGRAEIITAPQNGFEPLVKIFKPDGRLVSSFLAYPKTFKNGVSVAAGDIMNDGKLEIVTAPAKGGIPQIKVFSYQGKLLSHFLAAARNETYGFNVAVGEFDANPRRRQVEILVSRQSGSPLMSLYDFRGNKRGQWSTYLAPFTGNVKIITIDLNRDGFIDIITVPASGGSPHVRIFDYQGNFQRSFYAYAPDIDQGVSAAVLLINN